MDESLIDLPDTLTAQDIANHLRRSRRRVYDLLNRNPTYGGIKNFPIGGPRSPRLVYKSDFVEWIEARKKEQQSRFAQ